MPLLRIVALAVLLCACARAQIANRIPSGSGGNCETRDCAEDAYPPGAQSANDRRLFTGGELNDSDASRPSAADSDRGAAAETGSRREELLRPDAPAPEEETEFQQFVYRSTGVQLPMYGRSFFRNVPETFAPQDRIPVPADYTLAPGDQILVRVWGQVDFKALLTVDRNGQVYLPKMGMISVSGVRYQELHDHLQDFIRQWYRNFDLNVSLGQLRSVQVYVVGQARRPGHYTVSALSTLVNALFYSGGPSARGSMRRIQLKRQGAVVTELDLYELLLHGDRSHDAVLMPGDVIFVPPVGPQVAMLGSVNQPAIYELREGARVGEQIAAAGGLSATADQTRATLERIDQRLQRSVEEFALDDGGRARPLRDGDVLRVYPVSPRFENAVTLRGPVAHPGRYPWRPGMRISDLIPAREAIISQEYWMQQNALGQAGRGWIAAPESGPGADGIAESGQTGAGAGGPAAGPVGPHGTDADRLDEDRGRDEPAPAPRTRIGRNFAEINWDYAAVQRLNPSDLAARLVPFNLGQALRDANSPDNLSLEPGDVVTIFSQRDLQVPVARRTKFVWIEGEVEAAGVYRVEPGESLRQVVARAGGLSPQAYLFAADFRRESTRVEQQQNLERMVAEMDRDLRSKARRLAASVSAEERQAARAELEDERRVIEKLKQTPSTGRIVLDLEPADHALDALPDLPLEDGDRLTIPARSATVEVAGAVYNRNSFLYHPGRNVRDYLGLSGGATRDADPGHLFVIRADGSVLSKQMHRSVWAGRFESLKLMPGDTIVVPDRIRTGSLLRGLRDWSQVFAQFALGAAAIRVIGP